MTGHRVQWYRRWPVKACRSSPSTFPRICGLFALNSTDERTSTMFEVRRTFTECRLIEASARSPRMNRSSSASASELSESRQSIRDGDSMETRPRLDLELAIQGSRRAPSCEGRILDRNLKRSSREREDRSAHLRERISRRNRDCQPFPRIGRGRFRDV